MARHGELRHGRHGEARLVQAGPGVDWRVMARFGRQGGVRRGKARHGEAGHGRHGGAEHGRAWRGGDWHGMAGVGNAERRKTKMVYQYKVPYAKVSAQTAGEELARIEKENGSLTPELVVDESREENAPLHPVFEWDDKKAAERYRVMQAGSLIRNVTVKIEEAPRMEPTRAFVNVAPVGQRKGIFVSIKNAMGDEETRETVVARALAELEKVKEKYKDLHELSGIFSEIDRLAMERGA
ncbi:hypothetical protein DW674_06710 [Mitsuokella multacida]|uniref:Uncharacterized protein n=2 Tax=Mitsuokella multacida TaxID=52226 RepID=A0A414NWE3_9FIRM|nr:hypothetical protein DW674_06710 [Mitsuokella multacida]